MGRRTNDPVYRHQLDFVDRLASRKQSDKQPPSILHGQRGCGVGPNLHVAHSLLLHSARRTFRPPDFPGAPSAGWDYLVALLVGDDRQRKDLGVLLGKEWLLKRIPIPPSDLREGSPGYFIATGSEREITGTSLLAAAFYGIMTSKIRGRLPYEVGWQRPLRP